MNKKVLLSIFIIAIVLNVAGCSSFNLARFLPPNTVNTSSPPTTPTSIIPLRTQYAAAVPVESTPAPSPQPKTLRVWLPPEFDPKADTQAAKLFRERVQTFEQRRAVQVELRVKGLEGEGGMVNSLSTTSLVAPLALPDVVAMPRSTFETAALKGLLYPVDGFTSLLNKPDWYLYARQLATIQGGTYGIPFAGNGMVMVYKQKVFAKPPRTWDAFLNAKVPLLFPAGQPEAYFTLAQYLSNQGQLLDEEGKPSLDSAVLADVFSFYEQARRLEQMPYWLTQYETSQQAWQAYLDGRSSLLVTWFSRYATDKPKDSAVDLIPTANGEDFSLINGWCWSLTNAEESRRALAIEFVEYLVDPEFLGPWSEAAGYLPPTNNALQSWTDPDLRLIAERIIHAAVLIPNNDIVKVIGAALREGTVSILKNQVTAQTAVQQVVDKLKATPSPQ